MPAISSRKPYRIGRSRTGLGLFATKPIKKGDTIIEYFGPLLDSRNEKHDAIENKYLFALNGRWTIDGSTRRNVARYINHACRPNAESDVQPRNRKVFIVAIKNIQPGEEIKYDYGKEYFDEYLKPIGCKCDHCEKKRKLARAEARAAKAGTGNRAAGRATTKATTKAKSKARTKAKSGTKASAAARSRGTGKRGSKAPR
ncbi:SET domain-containing protein [Bradyrhizobium sp. WD16]|uniref:SET domain-containing protein n=1 Tax=Bradyrhizobium sp. WD16 TaxID=1521768 RepID=UPI0020A435DB|nr:SET domain-containing protein [Bradyrhizobium sp. WD16]UTD28520.1 SET domain-containing protein-lysine N-methyltransferase [Bradyrhizobium sp. WD16]